VVNSFDSVNGDCFPAKSSNSSISAPKPAVTHLAFPPQAHRRAATAASRASGVAPAPGSLDGDALQSAIVAPLISPAQAHMDGSRLQRARAVGCGLGASGAGVGRPDERGKLAVALRPLIGALSIRLQARPGRTGAGTTHGCSSALQRLQSGGPTPPAQAHRAAASRDFSAAISSARLGAPKLPYGCPTTGSSSLRPPVLGALST